MITALLKDSWLNGWRNCGSVPNPLYSFIDMVQIEIFRFASFMLISHAAKTERYATDFNMAVEA